MFSQPVYSTFEIKLLNFIVYNSCLIQSCFNFQGYNKTSSLINLKEGEMGKTFQIFKFIWISIRNIVQYHAASCNITQYHAISQKSNCKLRRNFTLQITLQIMVQITYQIANYIAK